jgi:hypothetical protein
VPNGQVDELLLLLLGHRYPRAESPPCARKRHRSKGIRNDHDLRLRCGQKKEEIWGYGRGGE